MTGLASYSARGKGRAVARAGSEGRASPTQRPSKNIDTRERWHLGIILSIHTNKTTSRRYDDPRGLEDLIYECLYTIIEIITKHNLSLIIVAQQSVELHGGGAAEVQIVDGQW